MTQVTLTNANNGANYRYWFSQKALDALLKSESNSEFYRHYVSATGDPFIEFIVCSADPNYIPGWGDARIVAEGSDMTCKHVKL